MPGERAAIAAAPRNEFVWVAAAAISYWGCAYARPLTTPIDRGLPWIAVIITLIAWLVRDTPAFAAVQAAVPMLVAAVIVFPAEKPRLLAYGAIAAAALCCAVLARGAFPGAVDVGARSWPGFAFAGVALTRWIGRHHAEPVREILIALGAVAIVYAFGRAQSTLTIVLAIAVALATPGVPARTVALPFLVAAAIAVVRRMWGVDRRSIVRSSDETRALSVADIAGIVPLALLITGLAWSGAVVRSPAWFWRGTPRVERHPLNYALRPAQPIAIDLPPQTRGLVVSVANGVDLRSGTVVGRVAPRGPVIRMGDVADWGYAKRERIWKSRNALPRAPAGLLHGYGYDAWIDGAGWIPLTGSGRITVMADPMLPPDVRLQIESIGVKQQ